MLLLTSFLASLVPPEVAKAAAQAAVSKLKTKTPSSPSKSSPAHTSTTTTSVNSLEKAAATAIGSAAAKSSVLATYEELEMQKTTRVLIEVQLKKMELKVQHFQEFEAILEHERKQVESERYKLYLDRLALKNGNAKGQVNGGLQAVPVDGDVDMAAGGTSIITSI